MTEATQQQQHCVPAIILGKNKAAKKKGKTSFFMCLNYSRERDNTGEKYCLSDEKESGGRGTRKAGMKLFQKSMAIIQKKLPYVILTKYFILPVDTT